MSKVCVEVPESHAELFDILMRAFSQATSGKGKERHGKADDFRDQPIMTIIREHGVGFATGQAAKKLGESHVLRELRGPQAAVDEILGAIVYSSAACIALLDEFREGVPARPTVGGSSGVSGAPATLV